MVLGDLLRLGYFVIRVGGLIYVAWNAVGFVFSWCLCAGVGLCS